MNLIIRLAVLNCFKMHSSWNLSPPPNSQSDPFKKKTNSCVWWGGSSEVSIHRKLDFVPNVLSPKCQMSFKIYIDILLRNDNSFIPINVVSIHTDWTFFLYFLSIYFVFVVLSYCTRGEEGDWRCGCREIWPVCVYCAGSVHPVANQVYKGRKKEKDCWSSFFFSYSRN